MDSMEINFIGFEHRNFTTKLEMGIEEELDAPFSSVHNDDSHEFSYNNTSNNILSPHDKPNEFQNIFSASFNSNLYFENFEKPHKHLPFTISKIYSIPIHLSLFNALFQCFSFQCI
mgnify:CR=1 FL=1